MIVATSFKKTLDHNVIHIFVKATERKWLVMLSHLLVPATYVTSFERFKESKGQWNPGADKLLHEKCWTRDVRGCSTV
eukprot:5700792-Amphidinium_carterae.1